MNESRNIESLCGFKKTLFNKYQKNNQKKKDIIDIINDYEIIEHEILKELEPSCCKIKKYPINNPIVFDKHQKSFLYRIFFGYKKYFKYFKNVDKLWGSKDLTFNGEKNLILNNKEDLKIELIVINNYVNEYGSRYPNEDIFPDNHIDFLYNFLLFLFYNPYDTNRLMRLDEDTHVENFKKVLNDVFTKFSPRIDNLIVEEMENNGFSDCKRRIVRYIVRNTSM